jgi:predicted nuclease of predicted toxin-antitoxin system
MKILLDEMYSGLKPYLLTMGYDTKSVQDCGLQGKDDIEVARYASENKLILVTQDDLPAELSDIFGNRNVQVRPKDVARIIDILIKEKFP